MLSKLGAKDRVLHLATAVPALLRKSGYIISEGGVPDIDPYGV